MNDKSNSKNQEPTIDDIINEIKSKSTSADYIYRGERKKYCKVSSALYREYFDDEDINIDFEGFDLMYAQKSMLKIAQKHIGGPPKRVLEDFADVRSKRIMSISEAAIVETLQRSIEKDEEDEDLEILTELQHYGGKTNLIDFTTDYLIAIFFACAGHPTKDGRVILQQKTKEIEEITIRPYNPRHRVIAQKSVFLEPPKGFINVPKDDIVTIPKIHKENFLRYLRKHHDISTETIYNDIHGFIRYQDIHQDASKELYLGLTFHYKGINAQTLEEKRRIFELAIRHYDKAIEMNFELDLSYYNRGECWLYFEEWDKAKEDLTIAKDMGIDLIFAFQIDYKDGVAEFENKTGLTTMPPDLAKMLEG